MNINIDPHLLYQQYSNINPISHLRAARNRFFIRTALIFLGVGLDRFLAFCIFCLLVLYWRYLFYVIYGNSFVSVCYFEPDPLTVRNYLTYEQLRYGFLDALAPRFTVFELSHTLKRSGPVVSISMRRPVFELTLIDKIRRKKHSFALGSR